MKKIIWISLLAIFLSGCSFVLSKQTDPQSLIDILSKEKYGIKSDSCLLSWYYKDIDRWITTKNCYSTEFRVYPNIEWSDDIYIKEMQDSINSIGGFLESQGLQKNTDNIQDIDAKDNFGMDFVGYENEDLKCVIFGESSLVDTTKTPNRNYISLDVKCSNKFNEQLSLQKKLLEILNGGDYPAVPYKQFGGIYVDRTMDNFLRAHSVFFGPGGTEMIFKRTGDDFEKIYEGQSGISCSLVQKYNIPSYVYGDCENESIGY